MFNISIMFLLLLMGSTKASSVAMPRIFGSSDASPGQFPFVVQLLVNDIHWCSGFIYSTEWVVTTASCVNGYQALLNRVKVVVGQVSISTIDPGEEISQVSAIKIHENYDSSTRKNNIAMLKLSAPVVFDIYVNSVLYGDLSSSKEATALGWNGTDQITNLKFTTVPIQPEVACSSTYNELWDPTLMICAGNSTNDACNPGDAGGPLIQESSLEGYRVVGLVSHSLGCGNSLYPTVYTRLSSFSDWMGTNGGPQSTPWTNPSSSVETTTSVLFSPTAQPIQQCKQANSTSEFPFIASILDSRTLSHICAGFIYNERFIVTTASCVIRKTGAMLNVTVGQYRFDRPDPYERVYLVKSIFLHPQYHDANKTNNIALVEVTQNIVFSEQVNYIYYEEHNSADECEVVGWASNKDDCKSSLRLLWNDGEFIGTSSKCSQLLSTFDGASMLCTTNHALVNCEFENGAPLIQGNPQVVVGIKSTFDECLSSPAVVYTKISTFFNWIYSIAGYQPFM